MNYRRGEPIDVGGMADVYEGVALAGAHVPEGTPVALKYLKESYVEDPRHFERFLREVLTSHRIESPNITRGYDVQVDNGRPVFVMELLHGETLHKVLNPNPKEPPRPLEEITALKIAQQICQGLAHAHAQRVIHRDIKPSNIHLGEGWPDAPGSVKLMDFGIARTEASGLTQAGRALGTPAYMSPEQIQTDPPVGPTTDLYALGVVLFEMLMGHPPFEGSYKAIMRGHVFEAPPLLPDTISARTRSLVDRLLAKRPVDRPYDARIVATELGLAIIGAEKAEEPASPTPQPPVPPPDSPPSTPKWVWGIFALGGLMLAAGLVNSMMPKPPPQLAPGQTPATPTAMTPVAPGGPVEKQPTPVPTMEKVPTPAPAVEKVPTPVPTVAKPPAPAALPVTSIRVSRRILPSPVNRILDPAIRRGHKSTVQKGQPGFVAETHQVTTVGGKLVADKVIKTERKEPTPTTIKVGTAPPPPHPHPTRPHPTRTPHHPTPPRPTATVFSP